MKRAVIYFVTGITMYLAWSCKGDNMENHRMAGVWEISEIRHYVKDTVSGAFQQTASFSDPGYFYLYDNNNTSNINGFNLMAYHLDAPAYSRCIQVLETQCGSSNYHYWYSSDRERLGFWDLMTGSVLSYHVQFTINPSKRRNQTWIYLELGTGGADFKEEIDVVKKRY